MNILLVEPFFGGSHRQWATEYAKYSKHKIHLLTLPGSHWKWRMHGGAVTLAQKFRESGLKPDLILATDMLDLSVFLGLTRDITLDTPTAIYFHENQLTYPWSPDDQDVKLLRDNHYSFINYTSALAADRVFFNSVYHREAFLQELLRFLKAFPDQQNQDTVKAIADKSEVLYLGLDLAAIDAIISAEKERNSQTIIGWNHRWEYDKNPDEFFRALYILADKGLNFKVVILGAQYANAPACFEQFRKDHPSRILHYGYIKDHAEYIRWLRKCDVLPVTSNHDFFGASVVEAMYCDVIPLLPYRLAYPEHIPKQFHPDFFYHDFDDLVNRLQKFIADFNTIKPMPVKHFVKQYDWQIMAPEYDKRLTI